MVSQVYWLIEKRSFLYHLENITVKISLSSYNSLTFRLFTQKSDCKNIRNTFCGTNLEHMVHIKTLNWISAAAYLTALIICAPI